MRPQRRLLRQVEAPRGGVAQRLRRDRLAAIFRPAGAAVPASSVQHLLVRHAQRLGEHGAQALVPGHQVAERKLQGSDVESAHKPHRQRDRVGRARAFEPIEEPQPALRERQRDLRPAAASAAAVAAQPRRRSAAPPGSRPSGPRTGCGSRVRHRARNGCGRSAVWRAASGRRARRSCRRCRPRPVPRSRRTARTAPPPAALRGSRRVAFAVTTGAGSARRSSLPFGVSGSRSSSTKADGTM